MWYLLRKSRFWAGNDITFESTTFQLQVRKDRQTPLLLLLALLANNTTVIERNIMSTGRFCTTLLPVSTTNLMTQKKNTGQVAFSQYYVPLLLSDDSVIRAVKVPPGFWAIILTPGGVSDDLATCELWYNISYTTSPMHGLNSMLAFLVRCINIFFFQILYKIETQLRQITGRMLKKRFSLWNLYFYTSIHRFLLCEQQPWAAVCII